LDGLHDERVAADEELATAERERDKAIDRCAAASAGVRRLEGLAAGLEDAIETRSVVDEMEFEL